MQSLYKKTEINFIQILFAFRIHRNERKIERAANAKLFRNSFNFSERLLQPEKNNLADEHSSRACK